MIDVLKLPPAGGAIPVRVWGLHSVQYSGHRPESQPFEIIMVSEEVAKTLEPLSGPVTPEFVEQARARAGHPPGSPPWGPPPKRFGR